MTTKMNSILQQLQRLQLGSVKQKKGSARAGAIAGARAGCDVCYSGGCIYCSGGVRAPSKKLSEGYRAVCKPKAQKRSPTAWQQHQAVVGYRMRQQDPKVTFGEISKEASRTFTKKGAGLYGSGLHGGKCKPIPTYVHYEKMLL